MARRRYLSTQISTDTAVNKLAQQGGDFAALLYTWMIPHAADDATLPGDPEELALIVIPGRRDKTPDDIADALRIMVELTLIEWDGKTVRFPAPAFYKYQTYIQEGKRRGPQNADEPREPATNSANQRKSAQNASSPSPSVTPSLSPSPSVTPTTTSSETPPTPSRGKRKPVLTNLPEDFAVTEPMRQWAREKHGLTDAEIDAKTEHFLNYVHKTGKQYAKWEFAWRDSMGWEVRGSPKPPTPIRPPLPPGFSQDRIDQYVSMRRRNADLPADVLPVIDAYIAALEGRQAA